MRVRTDENAAIHNQKYGGISKSLTNSTTTTATTTSMAIKDAQLRPVGGKGAGGLKSGAIRAALGDISNAVPSLKVCDGPVFYN
jgi:hypothetical protein